MYQPRCYVISHLSSFNAHSSHTGITSHVTDEETESCCSQEEQGNKVLVWGYPQPAQEGAPVAWDLVLRL